MKMKYVTDWYQDFPEPWRTQAIYNCAQSRWGSWGDKVNCARNAVVIGFNFKDSPEGKEYWEAFLETLS